MTRPDFAWAYSELSRNVQFPGKNHMLAAEYNLPYLDGTWNQTIRYSRDFHENPNVLWRWVDADWAGDISCRAVADLVRGRRIAKCFYQISY